MMCPRTASGTVERKPRSAKTAVFPRTAASGVAPLAGLAILDFLAHMLVAGNYGYFRDELYYLIAGRHLAPGYVDFPMMMGLLSALVEHTVGDSLVAIHVIPAVAAALMVLLTGLMARELGAGRFCQFLAALASFAAIDFLATGSLYSMDVLDQLWWALGAYVLIRALGRDRPRLWLLFGLIAGLGLLTKLTFLFFGFAVVAGILLTPSRRHFGTRWPWLGGAVALCFLLPYILWNRAHGWPTLEFWAHYGGRGGGPLTFFLGQLTLMNPATVPLSLLGLSYYLAARSGVPYRALGYAFVVLTVVFTLLDSKAYFLGPAYPMLFAAGAVVLDRATRRSVTLLRPAYAVLLGLAGIFLAPFAMPILSPSAFARVYGPQAGRANASIGQPVQSVYPQNLGDRFGWDTMTASVAGVYEGLPASERASACIFTANYGEASALNLLGPHYHLPPAISGHNNYFLWGPGRCSGEVLILLGRTGSTVRQNFANVTRAATITCNYCVPEEQSVPVDIATQPKLQIGALWNRVKHYD
jgi:4-amino-4-deoxy-L-arabinose transferase-like glycosyltransferase